MSERYDVIVVGAGFAGAAAARECATRGLRTLVLEGRDRIGGRTWTSRFSNGQPIDLGGTYVHWRQPHVWAELTRYGLTGDVIPSAESPEQVLAPSGDGLSWIDAAKHRKREAALMNRIFAGARDYFPYLPDPLAARDKLEKLDQMTIRDWIDQFHLSPDDDALVTGLLTYEALRPAKDSGILTWVWWWAQSGGDYESAYEMLLGYRLRSGIGCLLERILADGGSEVRLGQTVKSVVSDGDKVRVSTTDGRTYQGSALVVATPTGSWLDIDFSPALAPERIEAVREGIQGPRAVKVLARIKGEPRSIEVASGDSYRINAMWTERRDAPGEQTIVAVAGRLMKDPNDPDEVADAIKELLPHVEVLEVAAGIYSEDDPHARGGWMYLRPGVMTRFEPSKKFIEMEGRIAFATADIATVLVGYIDGAIETGLKAARNVQQLVVRSDAS
ncbi:FAD-dependent oxidoreductase [Pseudonocardia kujensis]|uniref:flavin monoamine oxidase family protein n=1 Tax=Pseudonocardia kujensis TaxID=1128675 RepID=UPI001E35A48A|nr:NAD(P)/FAD-dependent oxidoreductase [Pseudonocardia kujensis]MCE0763275.1 FAD-dependent oxidoreductase [Pseudonocardia kujensis]